MMRSYYKLNHNNDMTSIIRLQKVSFLVIMLLCFSFSYAQKPTNEIKAQIAFGINSPSQSGFVKQFQGKSINFPTVNLGVQYMFKRQYGAKLDFGFNRFSGGDSAIEFKTNYTRINAQFVYDPTEAILFLPPRLGLVAHAGPGYSFVKPLGDFGNNNRSFLNLLAGLEIHYAMSEYMSLYTDVSYIAGFSGDFDPITEGFGSFNGNLLTITFGITFSLSGCQYC